MKKKNIEAIYALSPSQQGMLFETLANPGSEIYIEQNTWTLTGQIDVPLFIQAWQQTLARHSALRTCFIWQNQENPLQVVLKNTSLSVDQEDWRQLDPTQQQEQVTAYLHEIRQQGFPLNKAPLMRLGIFRTGDKSYQCAWSFHHILMDGWGMPLILKDVLVWYAAAKRGQSTIRPPAPAYVEYIRWLQRQDLSQAESFWRKTLQAFDTPTPLGTIIHDVPQPPDNGTIYAEYHSHLSESVTQALQTLAQQYRVTLNIIIQSIWGALLYRYSGQTDVVFGATISGRPPELSGVENMVGMFINTVPVRITMPSDSSFVSWLTMLQERHHERQPYEYCSAGQIRQWSTLPRTLPLYDSILVFENYPVDLATLIQPDVGFEFHDFTGTGAQTRYALTLLVVPKDTLQTTLVANRRHFGSHDVDIILTHFGLLAEKIVDNPDQSIDSLINAIPSSEIPKVQPYLEATTSSANHEIIPPSTETEKQLLALWQDLLERQSISIDDNFFELGGHSLLATQALSRMNHTFHIDVPLQNFFEKPTIRHLASFIEAQQRVSITSDQRSSRSSIQPVPRQGDIPASFAQQRMWLLHQLTPDMPLYTMSGAVKLKGALHVEDLRKSFTDVVNRHEILRTTFLLKDDGLYQHIAPPSSFPLPVLDLQHLPETAQAAAIQEHIADQSKRIADLAKDPLIRAILLKFREDQHVLIIVIHHSISDGWSSGILLNDVATLYNAYTTQTSPTLPVLPIQYADFTAWQRQHMQEERLESLVTFWKDHLDGAPPTINLPTDYVRPEHTDYEGSRQTISFESPLVGNLHNFCQQHNVTLFITMLTALKCLLFRWTGQTDLVVGTVIANRNRYEIEQLIGCFINFLALRTSLTGEQSALSLVEHLKTTVFNAYAHQDCPFEKVVETINPDRQHTSDPLYNVAFLLQNYPQAPVFSKSLTTELMPIDQKISRLDLRFVAYESSDRITLECEYRTALFKDATITALLQSYQSILQELLNHPQKSLAEFPLHQTLASQAEDSLTRHRQQQLAIAATFTAEPIEPTLNFWMQTLNIPATISFAPYNQVFQELLEPTSLLNQNQHGVNIVLLRFEDWEQPTSSLTLLVEADEKQRMFADHPPYTLPNHLDIDQLNPYETEYLYQEIFVNQTYLRHDISFQEGDCIIDIGANIGMFSLFAQQQCGQATIYAFEPAPHAFEKLQHNARLYCQDATVFNCGIADQNAEALFTYYPRSSVFSSYHPDNHDAQAIKTIIQNTLQQASSITPEMVEQFSKELLEERLESQTIVGQTRTLSSIIDEYRIDGIDLLKIDAEKSELAILQGVEDSHWAMIKQVVMEVHDQEGDVLETVTRQLKAHGFTIVVEEETLLKGSGLYTLYATRDELQAQEEREEPAQINPQLESNIRDFIQAITTASLESTAPFLVCVCPASAEALADASRQQHYQQLEQMMQSEFSPVNGVYFSSTAELMRRYPVSDYYDLHGDQLGHIPFTSKFFVALGSQIARTIHAMQRSLYKVIAVDCDNTLWKGVCAEDGAQGIELLPPYLALQKFLVKQYQAGMLLCLCSKNQQHDVDEVFRVRSDMVLKPEHIVAMQVNWQSKSQNIRALAERLKLGLDSFIFIDDNPIECAEVRANCPEVVTLHLPETPEKIPHFLDHVWAFDHLRLTTEDARRTELYRQNVQREHVRESALTFEDFLANLQLEVKIRPMAAEHIPRVSQLTQRTNQFNMTTIRRSEDNVRKLYTNKQFICLVVHVRDRFGDYGLVGVMIAAIQTEQLRVDTFLLSCRALGRRVEHRMIAELGYLAAKHGCSQIEIPFVSTPRNQPAYDFLLSLGEQYITSQEHAIVCSIPSDVALTLPSVGSQKE